VLIVDHDAISRTIYREFLESSYDVEDTDDGLAALAKIVAGPFDALVTDARTPGLDGCALATMARGRAPGMTIIVITSDGALADIERAYGSGADAVLVRPCSPDTLSSVLERVRDSKLRSADLTSRRGTRTRRTSTSPPVKPAELMCPNCDTPLVYHGSHFGGASARFSERWDAYACPIGCGTFEYRHRTRRLGRA
jgi:DNA-binding NtrC family response regulator